MSVESFVGLISGTGGVVFALVVFIILFLTDNVFTKGHVRRVTALFREQIKDKDEQIAEKNEAIRIERDRADAERRRADVAVEAAQTSNILIASITGRREIGKL